MIIIYVTLPICATGQVNHRTHCDLSAVHQRIPFPFLCWWLVAF